MIDMVGIGPFVTAAFVAATMGSAVMALLAWTVGFLICLVDASVWSELGARMPQAGGSYVFLRESYGRDRWGRLMSFLFVWQTTFQAPLVVASAALGFMKYSTYLVGPLDGGVSRSCAAALVVLVTFLLYRRIGQIGRISVVLWFCVVATFLWIIGSGLLFGNVGMALTGSLTFADPETTLWSALAVASIPTMYSFLGYYNVCHLGAEVRNPERTIPASMYLSILGIGLLYLLYQTSLFSVLTSAEVASSDFVVSLFVDRLYGSTAAQVATALVLIVAVSSLFSLMLGYSRIPYAAARDGVFFRLFERLHPTENFPHVSLLILAGIGIVFTLTLTLDDTIKSIITMRVFTQFIAQAVGLVILRRNLGAAAMPWRMWFYPLPALLAIIAWLWVFSSVSAQKQLVGVIAPAAGAVAFLLLAAYRRTWPFTSAEDVSGKGA
ncbi:MAG TPA: amino acid permease [Bacteroidetes bacterium]|nr:amino acid permease [Bacteroidota bacterium]